MKPASIDALTSVRFFAAGSVLLFHMSGSGLMPFDPVSTLAAGVSLFFILSGFILTYRYAAEDFSLGQFYFSRFARLWPLHVATLLLLIFLLPTWGNWIFMRDGAPIFLANILLLQSWIPNTAYTLSFNGVAWSISTEVFFYAVFPLFLGMKRLWIPAVGSVLATVGLIAVAQLNGSKFEAGTPFDVDWTNIILHFPPMRLFEFLTGMWLARIFLARGQMKGGTTALELGAIALVVVSMTLCSYAGTWGLVGLWINQCGSFFAFSALIYLLAAGNGLVVGLLHNPILVRLGEISFATYMVQNIIITHAVNAKFELLWGKVVTSLVILFTIYVMSYALWRLVEVPSRQWLMAHSPFRNRRRPSAAPADAAGEPAALG